MLSFFIILFHCFNFAILVYSTASENCKPKSCGHLSNISYPFLLTGEQPSCGYASLQIDCNDSVPFLKHAYLYDLNILDIFRENNSVLFGAQPLSDDDPCGFAKYNLSSEVFGEYGKFKISNKNKKLYFFSNCANQLPKPPDMNPNYTLIPYCNSVAHVGGEYSDDPEEDTYMSPFQCQIVTVPVRYNFTGKNLNTVDWSEVLEYGFLAEWSYCSKGCEGSKGNCPQYFQAENVLCICPEKGYFASCVPTAAPNGHDKAKGSKKLKKIAPVLGSVSGFLFITFTVVCIIIYKRKHKNKKQKASPALMPLSGSSINSSLEYDVKVASSKSDLGMPIFTYQELDEATDGFNDSNVLGEGGFGTVYKGNLQDGRTVAIKRLYENNYKHAEQFRNEVEILSKLKHQNLVCLYGCTSRHSRELLLVYEFVPNGTVADHLHGHRASEGSLSWCTRMNIAIETADALQYLHAVKPQIIHRDVKTNNILLDSNFHVKVADFGLSRLFPLNATHVSTAPQGTPGYVDPEYYQCYQVTDKSDVYSFGVVLMELISSKPAVDVDRPRQEINLSTMATNRILNNELDQLVDQSLGYNSDSEIKKMIDMVAELACKCLQVEREMRPNIKEVLHALRAIQCGETITEFDRREDADVPRSIRLCSTNSVSEKWESVGSAFNISG